MLRSAQFSATLWFSRSRKSRLQSSEVNSFFIFFLSTGVLLLMAPVCKQSLWRCQGCFGIDRDSAFCLVHVHRGFRSSATGRSGRSRRRATARPRMWRHRACSRRCATRYGFPTKLSSISERIADISECWQIHQHGHLFRLSLWCGCGGLGQVIEGGWLGRRPDVNVGAALRSVVP